MASLLLIADTRTAERCLAGRTQGRTEMRGLTGFVMAGAVLLLSSAAMAQQVTICHVPPGNPINAHTIGVSQKAVPAHLAHGDTLGACECRVNEDCTNDSLCDEDSCVRGKCQHQELGCPIGSCVASASCVPETGQCVEVPVDCGDEVCDPSTGQCTPCDDDRLSVIVPVPSAACPYSSGCVQCCHETTVGVPPGFLDSCSIVVATLDDFPNHCFCLGCGCDP
jgi:hypothetical protein